MDVYEEVNLLKANGATFDEVKNAYITLVKKYHPDSLDGDIEQYTKVVAAYKAFVFINNPERIAESQKRTVIIEEENRIRNEKMKQEKIEKEQERIQQERQQKYDRRNGIISSVIGVPAALFGLLVVVFIILGIIGLLVFGWRQIF